MAASHTFKVKVPRVGRIQPRDRTSIHSISDPVELRGWVYIDGSQRQNTAINPLMPTEFFHFILWPSTCLMESLFVLRFYGPVNPMGSCRARSVYLTTRLPGRLSPLSG